MHQPSPLANSKKPGHQARIQHGLWRMLARDQLGEPQSRWEIQMTSSTIHTCVHFVNSALHMHIEVEYQRNPPARKPRGFSFAVLFGVQCEPALTAGKREPSRKIWSVSSKLPSFDADRSQHACLSR
ncbi:hypothetical protein BHE74_00028624 [Ensete ventricosum]|nr:hypothetical protein BHE74_00028624 [Ensete ventricosum]